MLDSRATYVVYHYSCLLYLVVHEGGMGAFDGVCAVELGAEGCGRIVRIQHHGPKVSAYPDKARNELRSKSKGGRRITTGDYKKRNHIPGCKFIILTPPFSSGSRNPGLKMCMNPAHTTKCGSSLKTIFARSSS